MIDPRTFGNKDSHIFLVKYLNEPDNEKYIESVSRIINTFNSYINDLEETKHKSHYLVMLLHETLNKVESLSLPDGIERNLLWIVKTNYKNAIGKPKNIKKLQWWNKKRKIIDFD